MDDTCAVCAETLEWAAYGSCGHREVCSTCVIRLRFVCNDCHCCICKSESNIIFITKALGDYTRMINDFSIFPDNPTDGKVGNYWYHEGTNAYFDDLDHYKMIKAMCKLSCSLCDKIDEQKLKGPKRRGQFKNIEELKSHLFQRHKLSMCSLCLEGRKVFICEQKLYTPSQLNQHIRTGDSEVDGDECERGGFTGHPMCEFCQNPWYGDNELYMHMSTEHYTCHICLRQHPGQYEYYRNYDDLEIHFRHQHFLCEDEACLAKKFVVFATTSEVKRHNAMEHGGQMSRAKRAAALQIPTSFRYQRNDAQDRRGRGRGFHLETPDYQVSRAIQASLDMENLERSNSSTIQQETLDTDSIVNSFEVLATTRSEPSSRYSQAVGQNPQNLPITESSFPALPTSNRSKTKSRNNSGVSGGNTMAARIQRLNGGTVKVLNSGRAWPSGSRQSALSASSSSQRRFSVNYGLVSSSSSPSSSESKPATINEFVLSNSVSNSQLKPAKVRGHHKSANSASSSLASNLAEKRAMDSSIANFSPVSAIQNNNLPLSNDPTLKVENVHTANKSLIEKIRAALEFDNDKYAAFKEISLEYRQGVIDSGEYLAYVYQFGLSHLVLELAKLCPDTQKQKDFIEIYNLNMSSNSCWNSSVSCSGQVKNKKGSRKGKEKYDEKGIDGSKAVLGNEKKLMSIHSAQISVSSSNQPAEPTRQSDSHKAADSSMKQKKERGGNQQLKKIPKFLRNRGLDEHAAGSLPDDGDPGLDQTEEKTDAKKKSSDKRPVQGVWQQGGGRKLVVMTQGRTQK